jgi:hypothetical protein
VCDIHIICTVNVILTGYTYITYTPKHHLKCLLYYGSHMDKNCLEINNNLYVYFDEKCRFSHSYKFVIIA